MSAGQKHLVEIFIKFMNTILLDYDIETALSYVTDDVMGIGMGDQGIVSNKSDVVRIMGGEKSDSNASKAKTEFTNMQVRCYEEKFGTVCGIVKIINNINGNIVVSTLGQMINFRNQDGNWLIYSLQATPIFDRIEEMEAYPIKFAENILEKYRQQEQIAKNAQSNNVAIYMINFTKGVFIDSIIKNDIMVHTEKGQSYEQVVFDSARKYMNADDCYNFISTFSLGNVLNSYKNGITQLSTEYEMIYSKKKSNWYQTVVKLYIDESDKNLKGYLYVIDINDIKQRELYLQSKTELDSMTGLYNKKYSELKISEKLQGIVAPAIGAFFMIDLDYFKNVNDTYGHREGDRIIKETADLLLNITSKGGIAGRLGGDEFCVFIHGHYETSSITKIANKLCKDVEKLMIVAPVGISCSIGIVICDKPEFFQEIYQKADTALYQQKSNGRNGFTIF